MNTLQPSALIKQYLQERHMMQLATVAEGQPWCCSVYFVADDNYNLYWASLPTRRHSREIKRHSQVAVAVPVKFVKGEKVAGLQIEGRAEELPPSPSIRAITASYAAKFHRDGAWIDDFVSGRTAHRLYKLTPAAYVLFDESNFPDNPRHEFRQL